MSEEPITVREVQKRLLQKGVRLTEQRITQLAKLMPEGMAVKPHPRMWLFEAEAVDFILNRQKPRRIPL